MCILAPTPRCTSCCLILFYKTRAVLSTMARCAALPVFSFVGKHVLCCNVCACVALRWCCKVVERALHCCRRPVLSELVAMRLALECLALSCVCVRPSMVPLLCCYIPPLDRATSSHRPQPSSLNCVRHPHPQPPYSNLVPEPGPVHNPRLQPPSPSRAPPTSIPVPRAVQSRHTLDRAAHTALRGG